MPRFADRESAGVDRPLFNPAKLAVRPMVGSSIELVPVVAVFAAVAGIAGILADAGRSIVLTTVWSLVVAMLVAVLVVHERVTGRLRDALVAADAEIAIHVRGRQAAVAERVGLETQLLQAQKMETIGQLASGLAHDFNNILMVAGGYADMLRAEARSPSLRSHSEAIARVVERGSELTQQLLAFARPRDATFQAVDVRQVVTGIVPLIRRVLGSQIHVEVEIPDQPMVVRLDACQLEQALLNLSLNARDAIPGAGRLAVVVSAGIPPSDDATTSRVASRGTAVGEHAGATIATPGTEAFVEIAVRDSGMGIAREHLDRIFEPFFTTKREGHGSGLGLAMVSRFAAHAGGDVTVESAPGVGTTVAIRLPRTDAPDRSSLQRSASPAAGRRLGVARSERRGRSAGHSRSEGYLTAG